MIYVYFLAALAVYLLGFVAMFSYSLKRDEVCDLERNPREAFLFALFWPVLTVFMAIAITVEKICGLVYAAYRYFFTRR